MSPKIVFSLNTYPIANNRWNMGNKLYDTIYMTALSVLYCCKWYENVEVYVDNLGYEFLEHLPCKVTLTVFEDDSLLWMKSKIKILEKETKPFIHVDNDVFFKKKIDLSFESVILEREDVALYNYKTLIDYFNKYSNELYYWNKETKMVPSCGLIGFANMKLKDNFVLAFYAFEALFVKYRANYDNYMKEEWEKGNHPELCLVMEQYNLGCMLQAKNVVPRLLLKGNSESEQSKQANALGYTHLHGTSKYESKTKKKIHYLFETEFSIQYRLLVKKITLSKLSSTVQTPN